MASLRLLSKSSICGYSTLLTNSSSKSNFKNFTNSLRIYQSITI